MRFLLVSVCLLSISGCISLEMPKNLVSDTIDASVKIYKKVVGKDEPSGESEMAQSKSNSQFMLENTVLGKIGDEKLLEKQCLQEIESKIAMISKETPMTWETSEVTISKNKAHTIVVCKVDVIIQETSAEKSKS